MGVHGACVQATLHGHAAKRLGRAHGNGGAGPRGITSFPRRHLPTMQPRLCCRMCTSCCALMLWCFDAMAPCLPRGLRGQCVMRVKLAIELEVGDGARSVESLPRSR